MKKRNDLLNNEFKNKILGGLKGIIVGISLVIPGLCSASTAITLNIYPDLITIFSDLYKFKTYKKYFILIIGLIIGCIIGIFLISEIYKMYPTVISFIFIQFILWGIIKEENKIKYQTKFINRFCLIFSSFTIIILLNILLKQNSQQQYSFIITFIIGMLVSLAFILPGISGALLLYTFGIYYYTINAIESVILNLKQIHLLEGGQIGFLIALFLGLLGGIIGFSKIINKLINKYPSSFYYIMLGLMKGSFIILLYEFFISL